MTESAPREENIAPADDYWIERMERMCGFTMRFKRPAENPDDWNICRDFFDPLADYIQEWERRPEPDVMDIEELISLWPPGRTAFADGGYPEAYRRVSIELEAYGMGALRQSLDDELRELVSKSTQFVEDSEKGERWNTDPRPFSWSVVTPFLAILRDMSTVLRKRLNADDVPDGGSQKNADALSPAVRRAYFTYAWVECNNEGRITDKQAYQWLKDNGLPDERYNSELASELDGYRLPAFDTWSRQVRGARKILGQGKYSQRAGRTLGRSVVSAADNEVRES